jgi:hypothetical protein
MDLNIDRAFRFLRFRLRELAIPETELLRTIQETAALAPKLRLEEDKHLIHFVELQFRFSRAQLADSVIRQALLMSLAQPDWSAERRLNFIEGQLVGRSPGAA